MANLAQLKKKRGNNLKSLQDKLQQSKGGNTRDERIWTPTFNKEKGKGTCIVRFLPPNEGECFVQQMSYSFSGSGGNFYGLARQTIGEKDPVQIAAINAFVKAKNEGDMSLKEMAKKWLPKRQYFANIYVVKDEEKPDNEGKVFIYRFGPQIFEKIEKAIEPEFDDVKAFDPFDLWEGKDFKIRMIAKKIPDSKTGKQIEVPSYENSQFDDSVTEFMDGDEEELEKILEQTYDLSEFISPDKFKSEQEVKDLFKKVTGRSYDWLSPEGAQAHIEEQEEKRQLDEAQDNNNGSEQHREPEIPDEDESFEEVPEKEEESSDDEEEDPVAKFRRLAGG